MAKKTAPNQVINNHLINVITPMAIEFHQSEFWFGEQLARVILITHYPPRVKIG